jgi:hypothetical protein
MKKFPFVNDQTLLVLDGTAARDPNGGEATWNHFSFLTGRIADPAFAGSRAGLEALTFAFTAQLALSEQREAANERGYWLVEDEVALGLERATKTPTQPYAAQFALTIMAFAKATSEQIEPYKPEESAA